MTRAKVGVKGSPKLFKRHPKSHNTAIQTLLHTPHKDMTTLHICISITINNNNNNNNNNNKKTLLLVVNLNFYVMMDMIF
jgi:hypothetical protein